MPPTSPKLLEEPLIRSLPFLPKPIVETQSGKHRPVQIRRTVAGLLACRFNCPRGRSSPPRTCRSVAVVQLWPWHRCHGIFRTCQSKRHSNSCHPRRWSETWWKRSFHRHVNKHHYRTFDGPSRIRHKNARRGNYFGKRQLTMPLD